MTTTLLKVVKISIYMYILVVTVVTVVTSIYKTLAIASFMTVTTFYIF